MTDAPHPLTPIEVLLKERIGLDAGAIGAGTIARAVLERQIAVGAADLGNYWNVLHAVPDELQALIEAVVVPETWFFRHREALLAMASFAAHRIFGDGVPMLRVLSVPCSTGEEPYSIVMALLDAGVPPERFRVDAVDVSARALERARAGHYGNNAFRGRPLDFRERYFAPVAAGYQIADGVRAQVRLLSGNLLDPSLLAAEPPYHVVFCRNLLIYFDPDTQRRAAQALVRLARPDGLIFVGPAEASLLTREGLAGAGVPLAFAFHPHAVRPPVRDVPASLASAYPVRRCRLPPPLPRAGPSRPPRCAPRRPPPRTRARPRSKPAAMRSRRLLPWLTVAMWPTPPSRASNTWHSAAHPPTPTACSACCTTPPATSPMRMPPTARRCTSIPATRKPSTTLPPCSIARATPAVPRACANAPNVTPA